MCRLFRWSSSPHPPASYHYPLISLPLWLLPLCPSDRMPPSHSLSSFIKLQGFVKNYTPRSAPSSPPQAVAVAKTAQAAGGGRAAATATATAAASVAEVATAAEMMQQQKNKNAQSAREEEVARNSECVICLTSSRRSHSLPLLTPSPSLAPPSLYSCCH